MNKRTRLFGEALRPSSKKEKFNLDVSSNMVAAIGSTDNLAKSLISPAEFIEQTRTRLDISKESAFSLTSASQIESGWFYTVNYVAVHEVALGVNVAAGATTVALAATLVAAALGVVPGEEKEKNFYKKINKNFLTQISNEAFKAGGFPYLNEVVKEFTILVKKYNRGENIYGV